jgi:nitronate monooxygenase
MSLPLPAVPTRIVAAPMAGGPSSVALAAAVGDAGGLGFLAAGYRTADQVGADVAALRERSSAPFGVNVFAPLPVRPEEAARIPAYAERLAPMAAALGVTLGEPRHTDDDFAAKVDLLVGLAPAVVSFAFGLPPADAVDRLHAAGTAVWVTVTSPQDAARATAVGADALVCQGWEAGAHRGGLSDDEPALGLLPLLRLVRRETALPLVAAGGIADGAGVAAALAAGAALVALGTAFLRTPEAGTAPVHAAALAEDRPTVVTSAFTGRPARALVNEAVRVLGDDGPAAYPEVHLLTAPVRAAARAAGDAEHLHLWAGQAHALAEELPAGELVRRLAADARTALSAAAAALAP